VAFCKEILGAHRHVGVVQGGVDADGQDAGVLLRLGVLLHIAEHVGARQPAQHRGVREADLQQGQKSSVQA
jgi:hypothetical protein